MHVPGGGLFSSRISLVFFCHVLMDTRVSADVDGSVMLQKIDRFGSGRVMIWAGIHHGGMKALVYVTGALTGIRY